MAFDSNTLNTEQMVLWFDDLGSGNEAYNFLSNFYEGEPLTIPGIYWRGTFKDVPYSPPQLDEQGYPKTKVTYTPFSGEDEFLNHPVEFATGEHAFQALKAKGLGSSVDFYRTATAKDASESKYRGRTLALRPNWESVKYDVMAAVVRGKYTLEREEGRRLLETGDLLLVEGTWWHDEVWGVDLSAEGLPGRNWLGTLLMARRAELRAQQTLGGDFVNHFVENTAYHNSRYGG